MQTVTVDARRSHSEPFSYQGRVRVAGRGVSFLIGASTWHVTRQDAISAAYSMVPDALRVSTYALKEEI